MDGADLAFIFYNPEVALHKKLPPLEKDFIKKCFKNNNITIVDDISKLESLMKLSVKDSGVLLLMSSGNFGGINILELINIV